MTKVSVEATPERIHEVMLVLSPKEPVWGDGKDDYYFAGDYQIHFNRLNREYLTRLIKVIHFGKSHGLTNERVAEYTDLTPLEVYKYDRYFNNDGTNGIVNNSLRRKVLQRDRNKCRMCGINSEDSILHIHHIDDPTSKETKNLISLCPMCHKHADTLKYKERSTIFLKEVLKTRKFKYIVDNSD